MAALKKKWSKSLLSLGKMREEHKPKGGMFDSSRLNYDDLYVIRQAWQHVLIKGNGSEDESTTLETYTEAVTKLVMEAKSIYYDNPEDPLSRTEDFVRTMIGNGCFILQVALCSLGCSKSLAYPQNNPIFGQVWKKQKIIRMWVTSIFSIRMQLPLVVLQELIKQSFFQNIIASRKNWKRPNDLHIMVLYDYLVAPTIDETKSAVGGGGYVNFVKWVLSFFNGKDNLQKKQQPPTLLHALWLLLAGSEIEGSGWNHNSVKYEEDGNDEENSGLLTVCSATELEKAGITFRNNDGLGIRGIQFKNAILYLPCISIERRIGDAFFGHDSTASLFQSLMIYEKETNFYGNRQEVCGYLRVMRELIRSSEDAKLLAMQGIIYADPRHEEYFPKMLMNSSFPELVRNNHNLDLVRHQIRVYVKRNGGEDLNHLLQATLALNTVADNLYYPWLL